MTTKKIKKSNDKLVSRIFITLICILTACLISIIANTYYKSQKTKPTQTVNVVSKPALTVNVASPTEEQMPEKIKASGTIVPWQEAIIGSELAGLGVTQINADVGQVVQKGQVLAKLNNESILSEVNQAKATLQEANAMFEEAKTNADIARNIEKTNALSAQKIKQYFTNELTAKARVQSAEAALSSRMVRLKQTNILAPDDGIISSRNVAIGNILTQGDIFRIIIQEKLQWKAQVSSDQILKITKDMPVDIRTKTNETIHATVSEISPVVNEQTRQGTVLVNLDKDTHQNKIKAGMFIDGEFSLGVESTMLIPQQALILKDGFNYVFILNTNQTVKETKIDIGEHSGNNVVVISGLDKNSQVVITGATFLKDGDLVKVVKTQ